jgi:CBS domain-containing protein
MAVSEILSDKGNAVITASPDDTIGGVAKTLAERKIGAIVVTENDGMTCGIISERDVVRQVAKNGASALDQPISSCMTAKVISCAPDDTIDSLMEKMTAGKFRHLPVIDGKKLVGIISIGDVVKRKIEQAERDAADLKQYIAG